MIDHNHKCIFIHISRTAGTAIETAICGKNWWKINPNTKHITASRAKNIYRKYWNDYFKFSFVRNPWDRIISLYHIAYYNGDKIKNPPINNFKKTYAAGGFDFDSVEKKDNDIIVNTKNIGISKGKGLGYFLENYIPPPWEQNQKIDYCEILDDEIDFIGKFENIEEDFQIVANNIGLENKKISYIECLNKIDKKNYTNYYDKNSIDKVNKMYNCSIKRFGYKYEL